MQDSAVAPFTPFKELNSKVEIIKDIVNYYCYKIM